MKKSLKITAALMAAGIPILSGCLFLFIILFQPVVTAAKLWDEALEYFGSFLSASEADMDRWRKRDLARLSSFSPNEYENYYLAQAVSYFYYAENGYSITAGNGDWKEYMQCFRAGTAADCFSSIESRYGYVLSEEKQMAIVDFSKAMMRQYRIGAGMSSSGSAVAEAGDVKIDFNAKFYTFSADPANGNPCVCDMYNNVAWPYSNCRALSSTGGWNKMICSSYAAGRYWEINAPADPFPLNRGWDNDLHYSSMYSADADHPIERSIVGIFWRGFRHDAFIETVFPDGSVIISECNCNMNGSADSVVREYGFRVERYASLKDWMRSFSPDTALAGMVPPQ